MAATIPRCRRRSPQPLLQEKRMQLTPISADVPPAAQEAWEYYLQSLDAARARVLNSPYAATPVDRAQGLYYSQMLSAFGFNIYTAPRQNYPHFYTNTI